MGVGRVGCWFGFVFCRGAIGGGGYVEWDFLIQSVVPLLCFGFLIPVLVRISF